MAQKVWSRRKEGALWREIRVADVGFHTLAHFSIDSIFFFSRALPTQWIESGVYSNDKIELKIISSSFDQ